MPRVKKEKEEKQETKQEAEVEVKEEVCGCHPEGSPKAPKKVKKEEKEKKEKKEKVKRRPSEYATFVKQFYHTKEIMDLPSKERFKKISVLWKKQKETKKTSQ